MSPRIYIKTFLVMVAFVILLLGIVPIQALDIEAAPHVIDVWPLPGVELLPDDVLTITFDQPMNRASVEAGFQFEPSIQGRFAWTDDRTLIFSPDAGWPRDSHYEITVATVASAKNGSSLAEVYQFSILTARSLHIASISPEDAVEGVAAQDARIVVTFDRPVVPLVSTIDQADLPQPVTIEPAVRGTGEWVNTSIYVFTVSTTLRGNTAYTVTIPAGLTASDGTMLAEPFISTFRTLAPQTLRINATSRWNNDYNILLDSVFTVAFSQPMDRASTEAAFTLEVFDICCDYYPGNTVAGTFGWNVQSTQMTFTPADRLKPASGYMVTVNTSARSAEGSATLAESVSSQFAAVGLPTVLETSPIAGESVRPGRRRVTLHFNTKMNTSTYEGHYSISPVPEGEITPYVYDDGTLALEFEHELGQAYTVTLLAGVEDIYGNAMTEDYGFSYVVREGETRTSVYPILNGEFAIAGTYSQETILRLNITGDPTVTFDLYRADLEMLRGLDHQWGDFGYYNYYNLYSDYEYATGRRRTLSIPWVKPQNLIHSWSQTFDGEQEQSEVQVSLTDDGGAQLPIGLYGVELTSPGAIGYNRLGKAGFVLAVANTSITVKKAAGGSLIWVTDFATGKPVINSTVTIYDQDTIITTGQTNRDGVFYIPETQVTSGSTYYITAVAEDVYGIWYSGNWGSAISATGSYLYTDRPIYRPGETVYYRGVIRDRKDMDYTVPDVGQLRVVTGTGNYTGYYGPVAPDAPFYDEEVDITDFGTFSGEITLPADLALGNYTIYASSCIEELDDEGNYCSSTYNANLNFEVGDFRVPEYEVTVTPQQDEVIAGDPINALVAAKYYFGGSVGDANITYNLYENYYYAGYFQGTNSFQYSGERGYTFYDEEYGGGGSQQSQLPLKTDTDGRYLITAPVTLNTSRPVRMAVEATVTDESGQAISARSSVLVHPANVYVGLRSSALFGTVEQSYNLDILTVTPDSTQLPSKRVELEVEEIRWVRHTVEFGRYEWQIEIIPIVTTQIVTDVAGKAVYTFKPSNAGIFRIRATTTDEKGRVAHSSIRLYAQDGGNTTSRVWWDPYLYDLRCGSSSEYQLLRLTSDSTLYRPGDTAEIFIPNPFDGPTTALVTVERAGVMSYEALTIDGDALTYSLPITDEHAPTVYFGVVLMRGISDENPDPQYIRGNLRLNVEPVNRRLSVVITPSEEIVKPGDNLSFDVLVTNALGEPVQTEVGIALTDEAALALRPPNSGTLEAQFYGQQPLSVTTSASIRALLTIPTNTSQAGCGGGGGGGASIGLIRDDFVYTPLWSPHSVTDETGHATVSVEMPDNLTRWRLDARAVSIDTQVGQAEVNVVSTLPLIVRPITPRFFVAGDHMSLAAIVNNNTEVEQVVDVTLQVIGVQVVGAPLTQTVTVKPNGRVRVEWPVVVDDAAGVDMTVFAVSPDYQDAAKPSLRTGPNDTIPIYRYVAPETVRAGGILTSATSATETISLPSRFSNVDGTLTVQLDPSLAAAAVDGLDYLQNFPHQCIEQTVSRFLPNVITYRTLNELGLGTVEIKAGLDESLDFALKKLTNEQNSDGGWGWFGNMESSPLTTAYALLGLVETHAAGYDVQDEMISKAAAYLQSHLIDIKLNTPAWQLNQQAFMLYVLGRWQTIQSDVNNTNLIDVVSVLYDSRLELSYAGRAYLLMTYTELAPDDPAGGALVSDLSSAGILSATGVHWEEAETDWWNWGSDTRTTALVLDALVSRDPQNPLLPNIVRWLMIARRGDHWQSTQETTWALIGLTDWMKSTGELNGQYDYTVTLNDVSMGQGHVTSDSIRETRILQAQVSDLLHSSSNRLVIERGAGEGALYYSTALNLELPADEVEPVSRGITVNREYFLNDYSFRSISSARVGDIITVRLSLTLPQDIYYFVLEDVLPAGTEIIDSNLLTATDTVEGPALQRDDPRWYWGYWYFDKVELRDKGAVVYADFLPSGTYVFTYQTRAVSPGEFQVIPAAAYAFYQPEVFGRTDGNLFTIRER